MLNRLIRIGICACGDGARLVARAREFVCEQFRRIRFGKEPCLEIQAGRQAEPRMGWSGETIDTTMLAATIGVDRTIERDVRRIVARDDRFCPVESDRCVEARGRVFLGALAPGAPAIVDGLGPQPFETPAAIGYRAASGAGAIGNSIRWRVA